MVNVLPVNQVMEQWKSTPSQIAAGQNRLKVNPTPSADSTSKVDQHIIFPAHPIPITEATARKRGCSSFSAAQ